MIYLLEDIWVPRTYYIMINKTSGKKYVGQTTQNLRWYRGSGKHWVNHCKKHGGHSIDNIDVIAKHFFICEKSAQQWLDQFALDNPGYDLLSNEVWANDCLETTFTSPWVGDGSYQRNVQLARVVDGTHHFQSENFQKEKALERVNNGTHHFLDKEWQKAKAKKSVDNGNSNFLGNKNPVHKKVADGTFHLLGGDIQRKAAFKAVEDGTHPFLKTKGTVPCYDKNGEYVRVPKDIYELDKQNNLNWSDREYASMTSFEGKKRAKEKLNSPLING